MFTMSLSIQFLKHPNLWKQEKLKQNTTEKNEGSVSSRYDTLNGADEQCNNFLGALTEAPGPGGGKAPQ